MSEPIVIGFDPSVTATGVATHDGRYMVVKDSKIKGDGRLHLLDYVVNHVVHDTCDFANDRPVLAVLEDLPFNAMGAGSTGQAQGIVRNWLLSYAIPYLLVPASTLKKYATGKGTSKKPVMVAAWNARGGVQLKDDNMVDAGFLRQFGLDWLMQADHRALYDSKVKLVDPSVKAGNLDAVRRVLDRAL